MADASEKESSTENLISTHDTVSDLEADSTSQNPLSFENSSGQSNCDSQPSTSTSNLKSEDDPVNSTPDEKIVTTNEGDECKDSEEVPVKESIVSESDESLDAQSSSDSAKPSDASDE